MVDRASRDSQTREKTARVEAWRPPSTLEAPEALSVINTAGFVSLSWNMTTETTSTSAAVKVGSL